ncbi:membrane-associated tyrosine- and threonine-specific cdc2-inhibitory kinase wee-1.3-like [Gordionus sp. m RMFG-2023]|uniref:membrane-associated tyrosine- and threonine-specific cdc2-inhibitory kinase wee-1.3-like n=1 Tax=Gordionus sp. m RMFG-2023 TaxID=3053472 RepID=UPI0031FC5C85
MIFKEIPIDEHIVKHILSWSENGFYFLLMELCDNNLSTLETLLKKHSKFSELELKNYTVDILRGLNQLHKRYIVHLDLKPENIFFKSGACKIGDFGLASKLLNKNNDTENDYEYLQEGDNKYMAPELLNGKFSTSADIFSLGITLLELATNLSLPNFGECWLYLRKGILPSEIIKESGVSDEFFEIISWMLNPDPQLRPSAEELLYKSNTWIKSHNQKRWNIFNFYLYNSQLVISNMIQKSILLLNKYIFPKFKKIDMYKKNDIIQPLYNNLDAKFEPIAEYPGKTIDFKSTDNTNNKKPQFKSTHCNNLPYNHLSTTKNKIFRSSKKFLNFNDEEEPIHSKAKESIFKNLLQEFESEISQA